MLHKIAPSMGLLMLAMAGNLYAHSGSHGEALTNAQGAENISSGTLLNSPTASTLGKNHFSAGFNFDYVRYNSIPAGDAHRLHHEGHDVHGKNHEEFYTFGGGYGVSKDVDLYLTAPLVSKNTIDVHSHRALGKKESAAGFGDMALSGKYRFWKKHIEAALIAGLKFPTGRTNDRRESGAKFEAENQPGTGSWDSEYGLVLSRSFWKRFSAASSFQYFLHGKGAQGHREGHSFRYNAGVSYSLRDLGKYPNLAFSAELNNGWAMRDKSREQSRVYDSGGTTIFVTPGMQSALTQNLSAFVALPVPVYQNLGGEHEEVRFQLLTGISFYY